MAKKRTINKNLSFEELVEVLIKRCVDALEKKTIKATVSDLIRIRALRNELAPKEPMYGQVTWLDSWD